MRVIAMCRCGRGQGSDGRIVDDIVVVMIVVVDDDV